MTTPPAKSTRRAFTLVELIAAMVMVAIIGTFGAITLQRATAANSQVTTRGTLFAEASAAMDRLVRKIQSTPVRATSNPAAPSVATFSATGMTWDDGSSLAYTPSTQSLTLLDVAAGDSAATPAPVLMESVSSFTIAALDESNTDLLTSLGATTLDATQSAATRRVAIQFTLTREGQSVTLRTRAYLRCTMIKVGP